MFYVAYRPKGSGSTIAASYEHKSILLHSFHKEDLI